MSRSLITHHYLFVFGQSIVLWICTLFTGITLLQVLNLPLTRYSIWTINIIFILAYSYLALYRQQRANPRQLILFWLAFALLFTVAAGISSYFYDYSYDGQAYQGESILALREGWNPFYGPVSTEKPHATLTNHYAKASWLVSAGIYTLTGYFESAKCINLLWLAACFCITLYTLGRFAFLSVFHCIAFALLLAFNPVSFNMLFSTMVDGEFAHAIIIITASLVLALSPSPVKGNMSLLVAAILYFINIKFTAIPYLAIYGLGLIIILAYLRQLRKQLRLVWVYGLSCTVAIAGLGYTTYVKNTLSQGHPFYPLAGKNKIDIINAFAPKGFSEQPPLVNTAQAAFARSAYSNNFGKPLQYKIPFTFNRGEIARFAFAGVMIGGFGVWSSGILLFSLVLFIAALLKRSPPRKSLAIMLLAGGTIMLSGLINPASWWARYVPQFWILPFIAAIYFLQVYPSQKRAISLFIATLTVNALLMGGYPYFNFVVTQKQKVQLAAMKASGLTYKVCFNGHAVQRIHLAEWGIPWREATPAEFITPPDTLFQSNAVYQPE